MELNLDINKYFSTTKTFKNEKDELVHNAVLHINSLRQAQNWQYTNKYQKVIKLKPETVENLSIRINRNPFLAGLKNTGELKLVLDKCRAKNNYSYLYSLL